MQQFTVPLSRLHGDKHNPRRVKPGREAHRRLVALIRAHGLLHPLIVRPLKGKPKHFLVIAGERRLAALKEIHASDGDPRIPCLLKDVDAATAEAMSLGENFGAERMHPLDEAEAFAKLATHEGKDAVAIAAEFGVVERYVRQRMRLATLAAPIKAAYRAGEIDTSIAEAFSAVPGDRQLEVWKETGGHPRHAEHVRNVIANDWIDAKIARFDVRKLPESTMTQDLFAERTLIERKAFFEAQEAALAEFRQSLTEDGWSEVVIGRREDIQDRLFSMNPIPPKFDPETTRKLKKIAADRDKLEKAARKIDPSDEGRLKKIQSRFDALEAKEGELQRAGTVTFSEAAKSRGTVFLILDPDGEVHQEYRTPRKASDSASNGKMPGGAASEGNGGEHEQPPTSDDLADRQLATTFTHQALCVREKLLKDAVTRKRILVLVLHDKVRSEALAVRTDANGTTLHAESEGFKSDANMKVRLERARVDPFIDIHYVDDVEAYAKLSELSEKKLDRLIECLTVSLVTAHMQRATPLVVRLAEELGVNVREDWTPEAEWLAAYQKIQLAHLVTTLLGDVHAPPPERKKSELVAQLADLFANAHAGTLEDKPLAEKLNGWLPTNLRPAAAEGK